jgi:type IV secretory pathway VirJ component
VTATLTRALRRGVSCLTVALVALSGAGPLGAQGTAPGDTATRGLPLTTIDAKRGGDAVAVFLTGDGGLAELDKQVANVLADSGIAVVALDTRAYLWKKRTPAETAVDVGRVARAYSARWNRPRILLVGYSHGANLIPFIATRLAPDVASHVALLAMLGLSGGASFQFHFADLFRDIQRSTDLPIVPELEKLRGRRMLCIFGHDEDESPCRNAEATLIARHELPGDHHFDGAYRTIGNIIVGAARR